MIVVVVVLFHRPRERPRPVGLFFLGAMTRSEMKKTQTKMKEEDEEKALTPSKTRRNHLVRKKTVVVLFSTRGGGGGGLLQTGETVKKSVQHS